MQSINDVFEIPENSNNLWSATKDDIRQARNSEGMGRVGGVGRVWKCSIWIDDGLLRNWGKQLNSCMSEDYCNRPHAGSSADGPWLMVEHNLMHDAGMNHYQEKNATEVAYLVHAIGGSSSFAAV